MSAPTEQFVINLQFDEQTFGVILAGLDELPGRSVRALTAELIRLANQQKQDYDTKNAPQADNITDAPGG